MKKGLLLLNVVLVFSSMVLAADTNLALGKEYVFNIESDPTYPDNGSMLTDGVRANAAYYRNAAYFGHLRQDYRIVVIDLEAVYKIDKVLCHFLNQQDVGIGRPEIVGLSLSEDGRRWRSVDYVELWEDEKPKTGTYQQTFELRGGGMKARYVAVKFDTAVWVFIDEFEVFGDPSTKEESTAKVDVYDIDFEEIDFEF